MKYIFMVAVIVLTVACHRASLPAVTPVVNTEIKNQNGQTILAGHASLSAMQKPDYKTWFDNSYHPYTVDTVAATQLQPLLKNKRMDIFLGSWCGDSKREVPRMIKILEQAGMDTSKIALIFVDNSMNAYKQSPQHEEKDRNIHHVPSFILYDEHKELGRIIESPISSLETDMLSILQQQSYTANYRAIEYWRNQIPAHKKNMSDEELETFVTTLKPLCKHYGEFNAYGYVLLAAKNNTEALNVFRLNAMIYPDTPNVFDSLAEYWERVGDNKKALLAYTKVLQLKPGDEKATKRLKILNNL